MITDTQVIVRLLLAVFLGGLVGLEREFHGRIAGFRTHILVCLGSALIMLTSVYIFTVYQGVGVVDPSRIAAGVVTGIGFLGAGTILRFKASVRGLTTAASLWAVAGVGLAVGCGFYTASFTAVILVLVSLFLLTKVESQIVRKDWYKTVIVETKSGAAQLALIRAVLSNYKAEIRDFEIRRTEVPENVLLELNLKLLTNKYDDEIISEIMNIDGVSKAKWK
jgi:putative Mg2+ transporter-C (MgtC) family protein